MTDVPSALPPAMASNSNCLDWQSSPAAASLATPRASPGYSVSHASPSLRYIPAPIPPPTYDDIDWGAYQNDNEEVTVSTPTVANSHVIEWKDCPASDATANSFGLAPPPHAYRPVPTQPPQPEVRSVAPVPAPEVNYCQQSASVPTPVVPASKPIKRKKEPKVETELFGGDWGAKRLSDSEEAEEEVVPAAVQTQPEPVPLVVPIAPCSPAVILDWESSPAATVKPKPASVVTQTVPMPPPASVSTVVAPKPIKKKREPKAETELFCGDWGAKRLSDSEEAEEEVVPAAVQYQAKPVSLPVSIAPSSPSVILGWESSPAATVKPKPTPVAVNQTVPVPIQLPASVPTVVAPKPIKKKKEPKAETELVGAAWGDRLSDSEEEDVPAAIQTQPEPVSVPEPIAPSPPTTQSVSYYQQPLAPVAVVYSKPEMVAPPVILGWESSPAATVKPKPAPVIVTQTVPIPPPASVLTVVAQPATKPIKKKEPKVETELFGGDWGAKRLSDSEEAEVEHVPAAVQYQAQPVSLPEPIAPAPPAAQSVSYYQQPPAPVAVVYSKPEMVAPPTVAASKPIKKKQPKAETELFGGDWGAKRLSDSEEDEPEGAPAASRNQYLENQPSVPQAEANVPLAVVIPPAPTAVILGWESSPAATVEPKLAPAIVTQAQSVPAPQPKPSKKKEAKADVEIVGAAWGDPLNDSDQEENVAVPVQTQPEPVSIAEPIAPATACVSYYQTPPAPTVAVYSKPEMVASPTVAAPKKRKEPKAETELAGAAWGDRLSDSDQEAEETIQAAVPYQAKPMSVPEPIAPVPPAARSVSYNQPQAAAYSKPEIVAPPAVAAPKPKKKKKEPKAETELAGEDWAVRMSSSEEEEEETCDVPVARGNQLPAVFSQVKPITPNLAVSVSLPPAADRPAEVYYYSTPISPLPQTVPKPKQAKVETEIVGAAWGDTLAGEEANISVRVHTQPPQPEVRSAAPEVQYYQQSSPVPTPVAPVPTVVAQASKPIKKKEPKVETELFGGDWGAKRLSDSEEAEEEVVPAAVQYQAEPVSLPVSIAPAPPAAQSVSYYQQPPAPVAVVYSKPEMIAPPTVAATKPIKKKEPKAETELFGGDWGAKRLSDSEEAEEEVEVPVTTAAPSALSPAPATIVPEVKSIPPVANAAVLDWKHSPAAIALSIVSPPSRPSAQLPSRAIYVPPPARHRQQSMPTTTPPASNQAKAAKVDTEIVGGDWGAKRLSDDQENVPLSTVTPQQATVPEQQAELHGSVLFYGSPGQPASSNSAHASSSSSSPFSSQPSPRQQPERRQLLQIEKQPEPADDASSVDSITDWTAPLDAQPPRVDPLAFTKRVNDKLHDSPPSWRTKAAISYFKDMHSNWRCNAKPKEDTPHLPPPPLEDDLIADQLEGIIAQLPRMATPSASQQQVEQTKAAAATSFQPVDECIDWGAKSNDARAAYQRESEPRWVPPPGTGTPQVQSQDKAQPPPVTPSPTGADNVDWTVPLEASTPTPTAVKVTLRVESEEQEYNWKTTSSGEPSPPNGAAVRVALFQEEPATPIEDLPDDWLFSPIPSGTVLKPTPNVTGEDMFNQKNDRSQEWYRKLSSDSDEEVSQHAGPHTPSRRVVNGGPTPPPVTQALREAPAASTTPKHRNELAGDDWGKRLSDEEEIAPMAVPSQYQAKPVAPCPPPMGVNYVSPYQQQPAPTADNYSKPEMVAPVAVSLPTATNRTAEIYYSSAPISPLPQTVPKPKQAKVETEISGSAWGERLDDEEESLSVPVPTQPPQPEVRSLAPVPVPEVNYYQQSASVPTPVVPASKPSKKKEPKVETELFGGDWGAKRLSDSEEAEEEVVPPAVQYQAKPVSLPVSIAPSSPSVILGWESSPAAVAAVKPKLAPAVVTQAQAMPMPSPASVPTVVAPKPIKKKKEPKAEAELVGAAWGDRLSDSEEEDVPAAIQTQPEPVSVPEPIAPSPPTTQSVSYYQQPLAPVAVVYSKPEMVAPPVILGWESSPAATVKPKPAPVIVTQTVSIPPPESVPTVVAASAPKPIKKKKEPKAETELVGAAWGDRLSDSDQEAEEDILPPVQTKREPVLVPEPIAPCSPSVILGWESSPAATVKPKLAPAVVIQAQTMPIPSPASVPTVVAAPATKPIKKKEPKVETELFGGDWGAKRLSDSEEVEDVVPAPVQYQVEPVSLPEPIAPAPPAAQSISYYQQPPAPVAVVYSKPEMVAPPIVAHPKVAPLKPIKKKNKEPKVKPELFGEDWTVRQLSDSEEEEETEDVPEVGNVSQPAGGQANSEDVPRGPAPTFTSPLHEPQREQWPATGNLVCNGESKQQQQLYQHQQQLQSWNQHMQQQPQPPYQKQQSYEPQKSSYIADPSPCNQMAINRDESFDWTQPMC